MRTPAREDVGQRTDEVVRRGVSPATSVRFTVSVVAVVVAFTSAVLRVVLVRPCPARFTVVVEPAVALPLRPVDEGVVVVLFPVRPAFVVVVEVRVVVVPPAVLLATRLVPAVVYVDRLVVCGRVVGVPSAPRCLLDLLK